MKIVFFMMDFGLEKTLATKCRLENLMDVQV